MYWHCDNHFGNIKDNWDVKKFKKFRSKRTFQRLRDVNPEASGPACTSSSASISVSNYSRFIQSDGRNAEHSAIIKTSTQIFHCSPGIYGRFCLWNRRSEPKFWSVVHMEGWTGERSALSLRPWRHVTHKNKFWNSIIYYKNFIYSEIL